MDRPKKVWLTVLAVVAVVVGAMVYFHYDPSESSFFPKCTILALTGYQCPGCGSQRTIHALLNGEFAQALRYNAMLTFAIPVLLLYAVTDMWPGLMPRVRSIINNPVVLYGWLVMLLSWWVLRNVFGWYVE